MKGLLKSGIDINLGRSCNLGCMFFYRQCKQQRDSGHQRCFNCNRIDFLHSYQQENCGLIPRKIKKGDCTATAFLFSIVRSRIPIRTRLPGVISLYPFSVNIDNLDRFIFFQVLTQFGDIYVHATRIEVVIVNPG